jgi:hypothetical protein
MIAPHRGDRSKPPTQDRRRLSRYMRRWLVERFFAWIEALVTERVGKGVTWMPFHFGGWFGGEDLRLKYPQGADPIVLGESANTIMTYGYDPATGMQEPKASLCQIRAA